MATLLVADLDRVTKLRHGIRVNFEALLRERSEGEPPEASSNWPKVGDLAKPYTPGHAIEPLTST